MTKLTHKRLAGPAARGRSAAQVLAAALLAAMAAGCKHMDDAGHMAGWSLVDATQRHPIIVSEKPSTLTVSVPRYTQDLTPAQKANVVHFLSKARGTGTSRIVVQVPSGSPNEVAALQTTHQIRSLIRETGIPDNLVVIEPAYVEGDPQPPIRLTYARYTAEGPECGQWPTNLGYEPQNLPYPNLGCANQRNLAAMVANPGDLLGPRGMDARTGERRDVTWGKYVKGESTVSQKSAEEKVKVKGSD